MTKPMKKVILCPNEARDTGFAVSGEVARLLREEGAESALVPIDDLPAADLSGADMIVTFGGDGTILHAARTAARFDVPLLGVNLGHKGFIAEVERGGIDLIRRAVRGEYYTETRMMADITLNRGTETLLSDYSLNDFVIAGMGRIISLAVYGDDRLISAFAGNGIVVATPTGSTASSLSAGGPIVEPDTENIIVTPICPHALWAKAYVLSARRVVTVRLGELDDKVAYLSVDGQTPVFLRTGDSITIRKSALSTRLIRLTDMSFYERVSEKLGER